MHVLPARRRPGEDSGAAPAAAAAAPDGAGEEGPGGYKAQRDAARKADAGNRAAWNSLFMRADTVAEAVAAHYGVTKAQLLDREASDLPVRMALGEAQVIAQTKQALAEGGVAVGALEAAAAAAGKAAASKWVLAGARGLFRLTEGRAAENADSAVPGKRGWAALPFGYQKVGCGPGRPARALEPSLPGPPTARPVGTAGLGTPFRPSPDPATTSSKPHSSPLQSLRQQALKPPPLQTPNPRKTPRSVARSPTTLLVKNLPYSAEEGELEDLFGRAGTVGLLFGVAGRELLPAGCRLGRKPTAVCCLQVGCLDAGRLGLERGAGRGLMGAKRQGLTGEAARSNSRGLGYCNWQPTSPRRLPTVSQGRAPGAAPHPHAGAG